MNDKQSIRNCISLWISIVEVRTMRIKEWLTNQSEASSRSWQTLEIHEFASGELESCDRK